MGSIVEVKVSLRTKNQMTLPESVVKRLGLKPGDHLIVSLDEDAAEVISLRRLPRSFAGVAAGAYGSAEEVAAYVDGERDAWD
jgi:AbrB family looped-hinge helix DNA binding protein